MFFLLLCFLSLPAHGADPATSRHRVALHVSCENDALRSQITSFLSRELRSLGDVDITDQDPSFKILIVAIAARLKGGYEVGYAFSVIITSPLGDWSWALSKELTPEGKMAISKILGEHESLEDHQLLVGGFSDLRQSLTEIIASFDAKKLEPRRRLWQQLKDLPR